MKPNSQAKIAWLLYTLLEEANDQLWKRYEKEFMRFVAQEEKKEIRAGERRSEINPDPPPEPDF
jgi:hypothetical protein